MIGTDFNYEEYEKLRIESHKKEGLRFVPETGPKVYVVVCANAADWNEIHNYIVNENEIDGIPNRKIECTNINKTCDRIGSYEISDEEGEQLKNHSKIIGVNIDEEYYEGTYKGKDIFPVSQPKSKTSRYADDVKIGRDLGTGTNVFNQSGSDWLSKTGAQIYRHQFFTDPWRNQIDDTVITDNPEQYGDGSDVDVIVNDSAAWFGHIEFVKTGIGEPSTFVGTNPLKSGYATSATTGVCGVLDLILHAPYYIDPDFFNNNPSLLTQRWDGTTVPTDSAARSWWSDSSQRSVGFSTIGTVTGISTFYTRARCNGSNTAKATNFTDHGTQCAGQVFGKNYGSAYNCNKWVMNGIGSYSAGINDNGQFDIQKLFHLYKHNWDRHSATTGKQNDTKNPTLSSNSWGYRSTTWNGSYYYYYRPSTIDGTTTGVSYSSGSQPAFFDLYGAYGDQGRMKGEMIDNSTTESGKEMSDAGVIFVCAAGNSNQTQTSPGDLDFNNYWASTDSSSLESSTHTEFGLNCYNTFNRRGWPQSLGKTTSGISTAGTEYAAINVGALDDQISSGGLGGNTTDYKERKVTYSDMGTGIDVYGAADDTLTADGENTSQTYVHPETYSGLTLTPYDIDFGGTSSACPTVAGWITTKLQYNRDWTWREIKDWLKNQCGTQDPSRFYYGDDITSFTATTQAWEDMYAIHQYGQGPVVIWDAPTGSPNEPQKPEIRITNSPNLKFSGGVEIKFS